MVVATLARPDRFPSNNGGFGGYQSPQPRPPPQQSYSQPPQPQPSYSQPRQPQPSYSEPEPSYQSHSDEKGVSQ